jgi:hypothetical protein
MISTSGGTTTLRWQGRIVSSWVDLRFDLVGATRLTLTLYVDTDGDGVAKPRREQEGWEMVFLRTCRTNPPNNPFIFTAPFGATALLPSMNFTVGVPAGPGWSIEYWEQEHGCR